MTVQKTTMGFETLLFLGTAGATATQQVTNAQDVDYNLDPEKGDTTPRGDGTAVPIITSRVTGLKPQVTFTYLNKQGDTLLAILLAAQTTGAPLAVRTKSWASGKGYDGDMTFTMKQKGPLKGESAFEFTGEASDEAGRAPQTWV